MQREINQMDKNCDFLTADIGAYIHFFKIKKIKNVLISRFTRDKDPERYVYLMQIKTPLDVAWVEASPQYFNIKLVRKEETL